ncbi:MAG: hypothetical protein ACR2P0_01020 [Acidimicrobiales bacterium]
MVKPRGYFKRPPGPLAGLWSWKYLDIPKTMRMITTKRVRGFYENFPDGVPRWSDFPEIELETTAGTTVNTKELLGRKHFVLFTGAIT